MRNRRELNASLTGATLGDPDGDSEDTLKWIKRAKKRERELARKRQLELENMDKVFQADEYTESTVPIHSLPFHSLLPISGDLEGLKVGHDLNELAEGDARILTLKDSRILDNEGNLSRHSPLLFSQTHTEDELQNVEMAEADRTKKNQELKIKRRDYTGYDDEEFEEGKHGMQRSVLAKYDEVLEGPRETVSHSCVRCGCIIYPNIAGFPLGQLDQVRRNRTTRNRGGDCVRKSCLAVNRLCQ